MSARLFVAVPLCDYEPLATKVWNRRATYFLVRACLASFARNVRTPLTLYLLADRCSDRFVDMARTTLRRFDPVVVDNSRLGYGLDRAALPDRFRHIANQFLRTIELSADHDVLYFCEQDYLFRPGALDHAMAAFAEIPAVNVLSPFDHPDRHDPRREAEHGRHRLFATTLSTWKSVSSTNGNWLWRVPFAARRAAWLEALFKDGAGDYRFDHRITRALYQDGELLLSPVRSLVQHYRLDGSNASPSYGFSIHLALTTPVGRAVAAGQRLAARIRPAAIEEARPV
jgi:hypothetical protein